jgi:predicted Zn-dependent protease/DNA-binding transcriptional regulator YdaS (Cro superfamily)
MVSRFPLCSGNRRAPHSPRSRPRNVALAGTWRSPVRRLRGLLAGATVTLLASQPAVAAMPGVYSPVEVTTRYQRLLLDQSEALGRELDRRNALVHDKQYEQWLQAIGESIAPTPSDDYIRYRFHLVRDAVPNAFSLPDGQVFVHTGMLAWLHSEAEVRALLAHEITHVAGHHGLLASRAAHRREIASTVVSGGLNQFSGIAYSVANLAQSVATQLSLSRYRRQLELEADLRGIDYLERSGGHEQAMLSLFEQLQQSAALQPDPRFAIGRSHPKLAKRIEVLRRETVAGVELDTEADASAYARLMAPLIMQTVQDHMKDNLLHAAVELGSSLAERLPDDAMVQVTAGDAWRALGPLPTWPGTNQTRAEANALTRESRRLTREERWEQALASADGQINLSRHLARAEVHYRSALQIDAQTAAAWRGLASVHELRESDQEAARAYLEYLRLAPAAADASTLLRRAVALADGAGGRAEPSPPAMRRLAVLPPLVTVLQKQVGANQYIPERAKAYEFRAASVSAAHLRSVGYDVRIVTREELSRAPALLELVREAEQRHDAVQPVVARHARGVAKGRFSLGNEAQVLAQALEVDGLVFQRFDVTAAAWGQLARAVLLSTLTFLFRDITGAVHTELLVVDGRTGGVVGYHEAASRIITERALRKTDLAQTMTDAALRDVTGPGAGRPTPPRTGPDPLPVDYTGLEALLSAGATQALPPRPVTRY